MKRVASIAIAILVDPIQMIVTKKRVNVSVDHMSPVVGVIHLNQDILFRSLIIEPMKLKILKLLAVLPNHCCDNHLVIEPYHGVALAL